MIMESCCLCGTAISEDRPRFIASLELEEQTRTVAESGEKPMAELSQPPSGRIRQPLCADCWSSLFERLANSPPDDKLLR